MSSSLKGFTVMLISALQAAIVLFSYGAVIPSCMKMASHTRSVYVYIGVHDNTNRCCLFLQQSLRGSTQHLPTRSLFVEVERFDSYFQVRYCLSVTSLLSASGESQLLVLPLISASFSALDSMASC
jgi:hypothetical protein